ncbi:MAG: glucosidase [Phycisphaerae bacterium]|nr:glucosidase [Phycisphaerae bacterium]MCZ2399376.1 glucosidase [Phycisphaerae bacterium]
MPCRLPSRRQGPGALAAPRGRRRVGASRVRTAEQARLEEDRLGRQAWKLWGPYLSERQWGTVREDYSPSGTAWEYFPHDHARSRAYRWGEDGLGGFADAKQHVCLGLALWNHVDPILKERLFGLTNSEGNHGEDVKELYYYLDGTPTHSYMKMLYKYPQRAFPYAVLVGEARRRGLAEPEFELLDTGIFDDDAYFDVLIEYAKAGPRDILLRVTASNRGPRAAPLDLLVQLWFRNTWSWTADAPRPELRRTPPGALTLQHPRAGDYCFHADGPDELLLCENETNPRLFGLSANGRFKDAFHDYVIHGDSASVTSAETGTKAAARFRLGIPAGGSKSVRARLSPTALERPFFDFNRVLAARAHEADEFYAALQRDIADADARLVQRQALAGLLWSKQFYHYDVDQWLVGDPAQPPPPPQRLRGRNSDWEHLHNDDVISMPDKWEYPWYAAWDLAFHCLPLALIDAEFAKQQLDLLTREWYMHPNGQLPAYEWAFGDVNPPVHAWATWRVFQIDRRQRGDAGDLKFLERVFHKLLLNFTWWVNRKDADGRNVFQGGFLGLDNIGVFDRSAPLPTGGHIDQSDGTSWMAMYCLNLLRISLELACHNDVYEDIATKFFEHFLHIAEAMTSIGAPPHAIIGGAASALDGEGLGLWDEHDKFYYDVLNLPDGRKLPLKIRSMVGLIPLFAVETLEPETLDRLPNFKRRLEWYLGHRPDLAALVSRWHQPGRGERRLLSLLRGHRMKRLLVRMLDESEFLSDYGVRALSKHHERHPYVFWADGTPLEVRYQPGESQSGVFGGNSNWRGPIWMPVNYLIIESLQKFHHYYGDDFRVECPTGSGRFVTINDVADELTRRLTRLFLRDADGRRPVFGDCEKQQRDPHFRDHVLFYEYFHGDTGRGVGASHQTGWTSLVAKLLQPRRPLH